VWSALPIGRLGCLSTAGIRRRLLVAQRRTERSAYLPRASSLLRALGPSALAVSGRSVCLGVSQYPRRVLYCSLSSESAQPLCTNEPALSLRCSAHSPHRMCYAAQVSIKLGEAHIAGSP
jgi:hypothetical protein